jgi:hypothetical protein
MCEFEIDCTSACNANAVPNVVCADCWPNRRFCADHIDYRVHNHMHDPDTRDYLAR